MRAVILAGGLGTRLRGVARDLPKVMVPLQGRPLLEYQIAALKRQAISEIVLSVGYRWPVIQGHFGDGSAFGVCLSYAVEEVLRGTGGALRQAGPFLDDEPFLVLNGDTLVQIHYEGLWAYHHRCDAQLTLVGRRQPITAATGYVKTDDRLRIRCFAEKPQQLSGQGWVNAGVYLIGPELLHTIPTGQACSLEYDLFPRWLAEGVRCYLYPLEGAFLDVGTPERYSKACQIIGGFFGDNEDPG